ncbi:MAG: CPXCG motif-containing cysteine-rich protein [Polyangiaceae bacterium]
MECRARCPYCWEEVDVWVDPGGASEQRYVEDCSICCRPWQVVATVEQAPWYDEPHDGEEAAGRAQVVLLRLDD